MFASIFFFARENVLCSGDDPNSMYAVRLVMQLLQGSREGQDAMVKLLQHGVPDAVVGNACVVIMQLANDAKVSRAEGAVPTARRRAFGRRTG